MPAKKPEPTAIAPADSLAAIYPILNPILKDEVAEVVSANLGTAGLQLSDLDKITVPPGGGKHFTVSTVEGDTAVATITGIILYAPQQNAYWNKPIEEDPNAPPICYSPDAVTGYGDPFETGATGHHPCATCPKKQWGSDVKGRGKACRDLRPLYLLMEGEYLPTVVQTSRMSLKRLQTYMARLAKNGIPFYAAVTEIGLAQESKTGTPTYSYLTFAMTALVPKDLRPAIKDYQAIIAGSAHAAPTASQAQEPDPAGDFDPFAEEDTAAADPVDAAAE